MKSLKITAKEREKFTHDINDDWHKKYQGKTYCQIETHSNRPDSPSFEYHFINNGFSNYTFIAKYPTIDRRCEP